MSDAGDGKKMIDFVGAESGLRISVTEAGARFMRFWQEQGGPGKLLFREAKRRWSELTPEQQNRYPTTPDPDLP